MSSNEFGQAVDSPPATMKVVGSGDFKRFGMERPWLTKCTTLSTQQPGDMISSQAPESPIGGKLRPHDAETDDNMLSEPHWQGQAYKELLVIRNNYSSLLDKVYEDADGDSYESTKPAEERSQHLKKLVNFLGKSRGDIDAISKGECYRYIEGIQRVVASHLKRDSYQLQPPASLEFTTGQTQLHNWRDHMYERIQTFRNMYSGMLDDAYKYLQGGHTEIQLLTHYKEECLQFLEKSLDFLGNSRADIVFIPEKKCYKRLMSIGCFVVSGSNFDKWRMYSVLRNSTDFSGCQNQEKTSMPNWRDVAYEELQIMKDEFLLGEYRGAYAEWSKVPELYQTVEELGVWTEKANGFLSMSRHAMALVSQDQHARAVEENAQGLKIIEGLMSKLEDLGKLQRFPFCIPRV